MIRASIVECVGFTPLVRLSRFFCDGPEVLAKLEFLNPGGSIKDRPARYILEHALRTGQIQTGSTIIESSSGNFGIALAMLARVYGLQLICVVDPKITRVNLCILQELGAQIEMVSRVDNNGGYLLNRLGRVEELLAEFPNAYPINQHSNNLHWRCHYESLGDELVDALVCPPDIFVAAVSTTATLVGVGLRLREAWPKTTIVAVDAVGSVLFGGQGGPRNIPGLGSSRRNSFSAENVAHRVVQVTDQDAMSACRMLLCTEGILAGGSSGAVLAAIQQLACELTDDARILTVLPDRGERYIDFIFDKTHGD